MNKAINLRNKVEFGQSHKDELCFVVMSFSDNPILQSYYNEGIKPTIEQAGYKCIRIDEEKFNGQISEKIKDFIKRASIVIVDLTEDKPNCYFEAGYAIALKKKIIFQRLNGPPPFNIRFEFDVKDYQHILYTTIADLKSKLYKKLIAYKKL